MTKTAHLNTSTSTLDYTSFRAQKEIAKNLTDMDLSESTTRSSTPEGRDHSLNSLGSDDSLSTQQQEFIIDFKPKRKVFTNAQERKEFVNQYKMKLKTELCKNFELRGFCKFGDNCSFAHGKHELQEKKHLHTKYKTKPCKEFHQMGYCSYGARCQYAHKEAFGVNIFYNPSTKYSWNAERNNYTYDLVDEIWRMCNSNIKTEKILNKIPNRNRLPVFASLTK